MLRMRQQRPKSAQRPSSAQRKALDDPYVEVREAFKRVALATSTINNQMPGAYGRSQALREARERKDQKAREAHEANLQNMYRRMRAYDTATEQKKNPYNVTYNPALLLRRAPNSTSYTVSAMRPASSASQRPGTARSSSSIGSAERPQSARRASARDRDELLFGGVVPAYTGYGAGPAAESDVGIAEEELVVPRSVTAEAEMRSELKHKLVSAIVAGRIYKTRSLMALFERAAQLNSARVPYEVIQEVIAELKEDLAIEY